MRSFVFFFLGIAEATEFHVSISGDDGNNGSLAHPWRTVNYAASRAQAGDTVTVHAGKYRERVHPPNGGVTFQAAAGDAVTISGADAVAGWVRVGNDTWSLTLPSVATFGNFNPYQDHIFGDWFGDNGRLHHTGAVYFGDLWLDEAPSLSSVLAPWPQAPRRSGSPPWTATRASTS